MNNGKGGDPVEGRGKGRQKEGEEGKFTFLNFGLLHLILETLLEFSFVVVGELGEVELGLGGEIHGWLGLSRRSWWRDPKGLMVRDWIS